MMSRKNIIVIPILLFILNFSVEAATHYTSPTGSATWANSTNISTPCSLATALTNATAGDTVYLRGGTYSVTPPIRFTNNGTGDADNQRIIFKAYTGETPIIDGQMTRATGNINSVFLFGDSYGNQYITLDGLTITRGAQACVAVGNYNHAGSQRLGITVKNCTLTNMAGYDNCGHIFLFGNFSNIKIQNNTIHTIQNPADHLLNMSGIFIQGPTYGGGTISITNNYVYNIGSGGQSLYWKYGQSANGGGFPYDVDVGIEIAYNYFSGGTRYPVFLNCNYANFHNNIIDGPSGTMGLVIRESNGGIGGRYNTINHNTIRGQFYLGLQCDALAIGHIVNNNIITSTYRVGCEGQAGGAALTVTSNYNLYYGTNGIKHGGVFYTLPNWRTHNGGDANSISGTPTFVGGATPTTIAGFALTSGSSGKNASSDGKDMGADITKVGPNAYPNPTPPSGFSVTGQ